MTAIDLQRRILDYKLRNMRLPLEIGLPVDDYHSLLADVGEQVEWYISLDEAGMKFCGVSLIRRIDAEEVTFID